jgi:HlyD family secretion protein
MKNWHYLTMAAVVVVGLSVGLFLYLTQNFGGPQVANGQEPTHNETTHTSTGGSTSVDVQHPATGMDLEVEQPGSVHAFESVNLRPGVSGFLKKLNVDIGDRVKKNDPLAIIDVPELEKQLQHNLASVNRAKANVTQMEARVESAKADKDAADAAVIQAESAFQSAEAWVRYRHLVYERRKKLFATASIEEALVDEAREKHEASLETERAAKAAIATSKANLTAAVAKIAQAKADVVGAEADVKVHEADAEKSQVLLDYATIRAPFDGEVTRRNFFEKDFIRSATEGPGQDPLLTVQRTDKFRIVVRVPDSCVPFLDKGDAAIVRIDSLPGKTFVGTISRTAGSEDPATRLMHVEIDLPNPTGEIKDGMYGNVKIVLDRFAGKLSIPLTSVVNARPGHPAVYVAGADNRVHLKEVRLGKDNGSSVVVLSGLAKDDRVVLSPPNGLHDGAEVDAHLVQPARTVAER